MRCKHVKCKLEEWQIKQLANIKLQTLGSWCSATQGHCTLSLQQWKIIQRVTAHIFCAFQGSRTGPDAKEIRNTQDIVFQQVKNNFYLPCHFCENRRRTRMLLFLPYDWSDRTFYSQTKVNSKTSKVIALR